MFEYDWKCAWGHADPMGIAYYPRLVMAMHQAGEEFMDSIGLAYWDVPQEYGFHLPVVSMGMEFERPVEVGDTITFTVDPELGTSSLRMEFTASHEDGSTAYTGYEQHVAVDEESDRSTSIPDGFRTLIDEATE